jgi:hypothetical protein
MVKENDQDQCGGLERRHELRSQAEKYLSVEFCAGPQDPVYVFRIRDESRSGLGILVKEGSEALKYLRVGEVLNMVYRGPKRFQSPVYLRTRIMHVTKDDERFKGHYIVGLSVLEGQVDE